MNSKVEVSFPPSLWYELEGTRLIDIVISNHLGTSDHRVEIKDAIDKLMANLEKNRPYKLYKIDEAITDEKSREFITFNDPDFKLADKMYRENPNSFGGLIYIIEVMGAYYCGLTERTLEIRFEEHIEDSIRGYFRTGADTNQPGYHKFYEAICNIIQSYFRDINELHQELQTYIFLGRIDKRKKLIDDIKITVKPFIREYVLELHYGNKSLGLRESQFIERFPLNALVEEGIIDGSRYKDNHPKSISLRTEGLNTAAGGAGVCVALPLYDTAVMLAMGFSGKKIALILQNKYNLFSTYPERQFIKTVQHKIEDVFGGVYLAQEKLLKPIIEFLDSRSLSRQEIYIAFKHAELMNGWFNEWTYGNEFLSSDLSIIYKKFNFNSKTSWKTLEPFLGQIERYYTGLSESRWLDFFVNKYGYSNFRSFKESLQKQKVEKILSQGYFIDPEGNKIELNKMQWIYQLLPSIISPTYRISSPDKYFLRMFPNMTLDQIWEEYCGKI